MTDNPWRNVKEELPPNREIHDKVDRLMIWCEGGSYTTDMYYGHYWGSTFYNVHGGLGSNDLYTAKLWKYAPDEPTDEEREKAML